MVLTPRLRTRKTTVIAPYPVSATFPMAPWMVRLRSNGSRATQRTPSAMSRQMLRPVPVRDADSRRRSGRRIQTRLNADTMKLSASTTRPETALTAATSTPATAGPPIWVADSLPCRIEFAPTRSSESNMAGRYAVQATWKNTEAVPTSIATTSRCATVR